VRSILLAVALALSGSSSATPSGLPNPALTPGATDSRVTNANEASTICHSGYTKTVRPPESYTYRLKKFQLSHGYAVAGDQRLSDYEEDHLVALEIRWESLVSEESVARTALRYVECVEKGRS
jgi:hypothetical protein